jgi:hypothetical protein
MYVKIFSKTLQAQELQTIFYNVKVLYKLIARIIYNLGAVLEKVILKITLQHKDVWHYHKQGVFDGTI